MSRERESVMKAEKEDKLSWLEIAIDYPLFKTTYTRVNGTNLYLVDLNKVAPSKEGTRNLDFEVVYPMYHENNGVDFTTVNIVRPSVRGLKESLDS